MSFARTLAISMGMMGCIGASFVVRAQGLAPGRDTCETVFATNAYKAISTEWWKRFSIEIHPGDYFTQLTRYRLEDVVARHTYLMNHLNGGTVFHGASSSALLGLIGSPNSLEGLRPTGRLLAAGKVPFGGELLQGALKTGVNDAALSIAKVDYVDMAIEYAQSAPWNPESGRRKLKVLEDWAASTSLVDSSQYPDVPQEKFDDANNVYYIAHNSVAIEKRRLETWAKLSDVERYLVASGFPVLFALKPSPERIQEGGYIRALSMNEFKVLGGVSAEEVTALFVPAREVRSVKQILAQVPTLPPIGVYALEPVRAARASLPSVAARARDRYHQSNPHP